MGYSHGVARLTLSSFRIDRERVRAFARFLWQRFVDDKCFETAGALSYTTLFAIVPLIAAVLAIVSAFPAFAEWRDRFSDFIFRNFVPSAGSAVQGYLLQFADNATKLTALGILFLLVSVLMMMASIEDRFNRIWRVPTKRSHGSRLLLYWAAITIGPLLLLGALVLASRFIAIGSPDAAVALQAGIWLLMLSFVLIWGILVAMYMAIPNRTVTFRHAGIAAAFAAILFEIARALFGIYVSHVPSYQQIYGALAAAPLFLVWIYLSWVIVLLGASLAAAMAAFEYRPLHDRLPPGCEFIGLLRVLQRFAAAQREGVGLQSDELCKREPFLDDDLLQRYLGDLHAAGLLTLAEGGDWVLSRDLATADLADLYRAGHYRLPLNDDPMQQALTGLSTPARNAIVAASEALCRSLDLPLATLFAGEE